MRERALVGVIGFLLGVIVMQWTSSPGPQAGYVSPTGGIVSVPGIVDNTFLDENGNVWIVEIVAAELGGTRLAGPFAVTLPVPVSDIKFWCPIGGGLASAGVVVTQQNEFWLHQLSEPGQPGFEQWESLGFWSGGAVPTQTKSIGGVKNLLKGDNK